MNTIQAHAPGRVRRRFATAGAATFVLLVAGGAIFNMTLADFYLSGTQVGDVSDTYIWTSHNCIGCHGPFYEGVENAPYPNWTGSLMGQAGRDPLFYAQMTLANQDVTNAGYYCMRCHVPMSFVTGNALDYTGQSLDEMDRDGVTCHFCHSMVDPIYKDGISPPEDLEILAGLDSVPEHYGNSMFVLDPAGTRRGPIDDADGAPHSWLYSPFHKSGDMCGTCHDVGNVAVSRQPDGSYRYNALDEPVPDENPHSQFPLERTYTEWKLSAFANGGVDMEGRFGGIEGPVVSTCQDCHMPAVYDKACLWGRSA